MLRSLLCLLIASVVGRSVGASVAETQANVMIELRFVAQHTYGDPFNQVLLDVTFTDPAGQPMRVPAFWAGENVWKVRYASAIPGVHTYRTECNQPSDAGLEHVAGQVRITPYVGNNPLYKHGPLRVAANHRYLEHVDGTPFFWLGDTWWMGLCHRLHWPDEVHTLAQDRKAKGFTVIQIVAGLYPDMEPFDPRGANEAGFPWETHYTAIRPQYFDAADQRLMYLVDQGLTPCIVGGWGYFMEWMGPKKLEQHWRYLIARYGALPVVWCAAGEANLEWYRDPNFPYDDRPQVTQWTEVMRHLKATDPYHHPITIHPTGIGRLSSRHATDDPKLLDIDMLQTPHAERGAVAPTVNTVRASYADAPRMPVINGEAAYEMLNGVITAEWTRRMFWLCMTNGAAGHTYGANGIWQCNRPGQPHGPSPTAGSPPTGYGVTPWSEAMNFPGSRQEGLGKALFEQFQWWKFEPHPEWSAYPTKPALSFQNSKWIWFPAGDPTKDAPAETIYFRRTFTLPADKAIASAQLRISADDRCQVRLNGHPLGGNTIIDDWSIGDQFDDLAGLVKAGNNDIAVQAQNMPTRGPNPAGLIACLEIHFADGSATSIVSDPQWRTSKQLFPQWETTGFDDANWSGAMPVANYGAGPWGQIKTPKTDPVFGPQSTGIPQGIRLIYVPDPRPIELRNLQASATYSATAFDPVTGEKKILAAIHADDHGNAKCATDASHDWVLLLEPRSGPPSGGR